MTLMQGTGTGAHRSRVNRVYTYCIKVSTCAFCSSWAGERAGFSQDKRDSYKPTDFGGGRWVWGSPSPSLEATLSGRPLPGGVSPPKGLAGVDVGAGEVGRPCALACA